MSFASTRTLFSQVLGSEKNTASRCKAFQPSCQAIRRRGYSSLAASHPTWAWPSHHFSDETGIPSIESTALRSGPVAGCQHDSGRMVGQPEVIPLLRFARHPGFIQIQHPECRFRPHKKRAPTNRTGMMRARCPAAAAWDVRLKKESLSGRPHGGASLRGMSHVPALILSSARTTAMAAMDVRVDENQPEEEGFRRREPEISSEMSKAGEVYENPVTGERAVIRIGTDTTGGELLVADVYVRPGGAVMGEHFHPGMEERFAMLRGQVGFRLAGRVAIAEPGVELIAPPGTPHDWWNAGPEEALVRVEIRPAARFEAMIRNAFGLAQDGKVNKRGMPNLLQL